MKALEAEVVLLLRSDPTEDDRDAAVGAVRAFVRASKATGMARAAAIDLLKAACDVVADFDDDAEGAE